MTEKSPERLALEAKAVDLGLSFPANIGDPKLAERVASAEADRDKDTKPTGDGKVGSVQSSTDPQPELLETVTVIGPKQGRRRIGYRFGTEPVEIPVDDLTAEQIDALKNDPSLAVTLPVSAKD